MKRIPIDDRLKRRRIVNGDGCWIWTGAVNNAGYGGITMQTPVGPKRRTVHRVAYEHYVGPVPSGLQLDHLCRERRCFNPAHLEPVTARENVMRSPIAPAAVNARKTHCPRGHAYVSENLYAVTPAGGRQCRTCAADRRTVAAR